MPRKVLFVCSGNQCRSPFAEAVLDKFIQRDGRTDIVVDSAGTIAMGGEPANIEAQRVAQGMGLDLGNHRARKLLIDTLVESDHIMIMDEGHRESVLLLCPSCENKVEMLGAYAPAHDFGDEIPDPMGQNQLAFRTCFSRIIEAVDAFYNKLGKELDA